MMKNRKNIVVLVPCYNEEAVLAHFVEAFAGVRGQLADKISVDLLFINDGSTDKTLSIIKKYAKANKYIYYRSFSVNTGHQSALRAGIAAAGDYDAVIMMDADLQHPPACIPKMLDKWQESSAGIVQMLRQDSKKDVGFVKYATSRLYYSVINWLSNLRLEYGASDFRLIDKKVVSIVNHSPENDLFLRGYFSSLPIKRETVDYIPAARIAGNSKYTFRKMYKLAREGILQFSEKPLYIAVNVGLLFAVLSFLYGLYLVFEYFAGSGRVSGWTSLMVLLLFCFGINFILIGIVGRYLAHGISLQKKRPEYVIAEESLPINRGKQ